MEIGDLIRDLRMDLCMSCRELSRLSGVCHTTINDIENGICYPTLNTVIRLCAGLDFDLFDFLDITNYFKNQGITVDSGTSLVTDDEKILLHHGDTIEEYAKLPNLAYVKGLDNCYMIRKLGKINVYDKQKNK